jgi:hypothetical protein
MEKFLTTLITFLIISTVSGQTFEGKITYQNSYKSNLPNVTDQQFTSMMGSTQEYIIKGGNYKSSTNGTMFTWQLYLNSDNKLYSKMSNSETILWNDGSINKDSILKVELNKQSAEILGYMCDELVLTCKSGIQKYYFSSKIAVDVSLFSNHLYGNWYDYVKLAKALPLKIVMETESFTLTSVAIEVMELKIDEKELKLPENAKTAKSPY